MVVRVLDGRWPPSAAQAGIEGVAERVAQPIEAEHGDADGQAGPIEAPKGPPKVVAGTEVPASRLAYYKGEEAPGLFGPRGWHCRVWYGSSGSTLIITPTLIDSTLGLPRKLQGEALELSVSSGGTSGRFVVAHYAARLFPRVAAKFIARVQNEGLAPASEFQSGPYPHDSVKYLGTLVAEFTTPAGVIISSSP